MDPHENDTNSVEQLDPFTEDKVLKSGALLLFLVGLDNFALIN